MDKNKEKSQKEEKQNKTGPPLSSRSGLYPPLNSHLNKWGHGKLPNPTFLVPFGGITGVSGSSGLAMGIQGMPAWKSGNKSTVSLLYKVLNRLVPSYRGDFFSSKKNTTHYNLRGSFTSLQLPQPKSEFLKKRVCYSGANSKSLFASPCNSKTVATLMRTLFNISAALASEISLSNYCLRVSASNW